MERQDAGCGRRRVGRARAWRWRGSDELWERLGPLLADPPRRFRHPGRARLLPLLGARAERGIRPGELWADRGYASAGLEQALLGRRIEPRISKPRRAGQPLPADTPTRLVWRGRRRRLRTPDPQARHRW